ncbi:MAG: hypothetical protein HYR70_04540 [Chloroflexi bacterium]|nr:hypothetical protein [Chloroflexota bacterium]MBI3340825.1 hypothetical protein [Chloroflexota bacterium]
MCPSKPRIVLVEKCGDIFTTPLFWDCECERDYIHACLEEACPVCKAAQEESPDARVDEVFRHSSGLNNKLIAALEVICDSVCPDLVPIPF